MTPSTGLSKNQEWYLSASRLRGSAHDAAIEQMLAVRTVGDLTNDHRGWQVAIKDSQSIKGYVQVQFSGVRLWEYDGHSMVGVKCKEYDKPYKYSERAYEATTPCELLFQSLRPRRKRTKAESS